MDTRTKLIDIEKKRLKIFYWFFYIKKTIKKLIFFIKNYIILLINE